MPFLPCASGDEFFKISLMIIGKALAGIRFMNSRKGFFDDVYYTVSESG